jgi:hypothetical protein
MLIPDVVSKESFEDLAKRYGDKPHLVQAFQPKIKVNYGGKNEPVPIRAPLLAPPPPTFIERPRSNHSPGKPAIKFSYGGGSGNGPSTQPRSSSPQSRPVYVQPQVNQTSKVE